MAATKPMASLSGGLLARKGEARPAMRRSDSLAALASAGDELGWNDMGHGAPATLPPVLASRERLMMRLGEAPCLAEPVPAPVAGKRVAFTVRLDPERHQRLRMAAAAQGLSAQALMITALDQLAPADAA